MQLIFSIEASLENAGQVSWFSQLGLHDQSTKRRARISHFRRCSSFAIVCSTLISSLYPPPPPHLSLSLSLSLSVSLSLYSRLDRYMLTRTVTKCLVVSVTRDASAEHVTTDLGVIQRRGYKSAKKKTRAAKRWRTVDKISTRSKAKNVLSTGQLEQWPSLCRFSFCWRCSTPDSTWSGRIASEPMTAHVETRRPAW